MSKIMNGKIRTKSARESYIEQLSYNKNKKRKSSTRLHSFDDSDIAYRSAPEYLRHLMNTSTLSNGNSVKSFTRTQSASEITARNNLNRTVIGNPKYKAQEDYYDEIQLLKKELKYTKDDNSNLRAKIRRLEEDNSRKYREIDNLYDPNKDGDLRRTLTNSSTPTANVVMNLKQRVFKLELQLKQRETTIDEMKNDPRWTKGTELEIQNRALFNELEKQKIERLNFIQHDYMASIDEEQKNAVRKLEAEKRELKTENESLKKKVNEFEKLDRNEQLSARQRDGSTDRDLRRKIDDLKELCTNYENELDHMKDNLKQMRRERDKFRDKLDNIKEELEEIKCERNQYRQQLDGINYDPDRHRKLNRSPHSSTAVSHRDLSPSEDPTKRGSRPNTPIRKANEHMGSHLSSTKLDRNTASPFDNLGSSTIKHQSSSANILNESALKIVQASLRGCINRIEMDKTSRIQKSHRIDSDDDDDIIRPQSRQFENERKRENFLHHSKQNFGDSNSLCNDKIGSNNRDLTSKFHRSPSPPFDHYRPSSPHIGTGGGSKQNLPYDRNRLGSSNRFPLNDRESSSKLRRSPSPPLVSHRPSSARIGTGGDSKQNLPYDRNKLGSSNRFSMNDRELLSKLRRSPSPPADIHHSSSPRFGSGSDFKQSLSNDKNKFSFDNRIDRESSLKFQRPSSASNDHRLSPHISPENTRPSSHQSNITLRKSPTNSKQSHKNIHNNDDDIFDF